METRENNDKREERGKQIGKEELVNGGKRMVKQGYGIMRKKDGDKEEQLYVRMVKYKDGEKGGWRRRLGEEEKNRIKEGKKIFLCEKKKWNKRKTGG